MFHFGREALDLDSVLDELPPAYTLAHSGSERFVAGPTGLFVVGMGGDHPGRRSRRIVGVAREVRMRLAQYLVWVPFIDALVVTRETPEESEAMDATIVPIDLLEELVIQGTQRVDEETLAKVVALVVERRLGWEPLRTSGSANPETGGSEFGLREEHEEPAAS